MGVWDGEMAGEHTDSGLGHEKTRQERDSVKGLEEETRNESQRKRKRARCGDNR